MSEVSRPFVVNKCMYVCMYVCVSIRRILCDRSLSFLYLFCHSVNRITDERGNGHWPILARGDLLNTSSLFYGKQSNTVRFYLPSFLVFLVSVMSRKSEISPEMFESILVKVTEKFTEIFKSYMDQIVSTLVNRVDNIESKVDASMAVINNRVNDLERKLQQTSSNPNEQSDQILKTLMALELE